MAEKYNHSDAPEADLGRLDDVQTSAWLRGVLRRRRIIGLNRIQARIYDASGSEQDLEEDLTSLYQTI